MRNYYYINIIISFNQAIQLNPKDVLARLNKGNVLYNLGR